MVLMSVLNNTLVNITNAERRGKRQVIIRPSSKVVVKFLSTMQKHGKELRCSVSLCALIALVVCQLSRSRARATAGLRCAQSPVSVSSSASIQFRPSGLLRFTTTGVSHRAAPCHSATTDLAFYAIPDAFDLWQV